jgi:hypothetical protein
MLSYVDTRTVFELVYPYVPMIGQAVLSQVAREGVDLSVAIVPSAAAIESHLRPSVGTLQRTSAGIEVTSRQTLPGGNLGASAPVAVALLLPAVQSAREAARRAQSMNNLKQIALAMHNYADTHGGFPPAYVADKDGKPLLSWRVLILPYLEQQALYEQFRLDEPWDSEHNKKLSETAIAVYHDPNGPPTPWMTNYLTVRGEDTAFPGKEGIKFAQITDGTSNTIMLVEVNNSQAVPWAKPADFEPNQQNPLAGLVGLRPGGFLAAFCDGSVRFISATTDPQVLKAMFTRNGGEVTAPGSTPGALAPR